MTEIKEPFLKRLKKARPSIYTLALLGVAVYFWFRPPASISDETKPLSPFTTQLIDGRLASKDHLQGKVVLVNFWATWCPFCQHEMPAMETFYQEYKNKDFEMLALSIDDDAGVVKQFIAKNGYSFPVGMANSTTTSAFGRIPGVPVSSQWHTHRAAMKSLPAS